MNQENIRNFCIIAHIDHGKSTLADRLLEVTGTIDKRKLKKQTLDSMELEREKGITIKLKAVRMEYELDNTTYELNLIDTPGHVDFAYEVSRSLAACEGAILIVDASQGIEAQTVSNMYKALDANLKIIPVINKIDLPGIDVDQIVDDMAHAFGFDENEILKISAKTGEGIGHLVENIITQIPAPKVVPDAPLRALVFDTFYDDFLGVIAMVKIVDGHIDNQTLRARNKLICMTTRTSFNAESIGIMSPERHPIEKLSAGEVGYIATTLKDIHAVHVGDTIAFDKDKETVEKLPGYRQIKPFVFVSIFPIENDKFPELREALEKLSLSDASLQFEPESSSALGFGFRCGFLGLLHADIIQERLEREYNLTLISTIPTVEYHVFKTDGTELPVKAASDLPDRTRINYVEEPWILTNIIAPAQFVGGIIPLCEERRGIMRKMEYPTVHTVSFEYELPLSELIHNFFDELKTVSSGYASIDYDFLGYRQVDVVKMDILVHGTIIEPLSQIVIKENAEETGRKTLKKLKDVLPKQQFSVAIQAAIGGKIIAREDLQAYRKDVLAHIYGGHRERKDKLLDRQKEGKQRMKKIGKVDIPQEAFREILKS